MFDLAHIHPMLVHFPLALFPAALVAQSIAVASGGSVFQRTCSARAGFLLLLSAAISAVAAAVFGDQALDIARDAGVPMAQMESHEELGQLAAALLSGLFVFNAVFYTRQSSSLRFSLFTVAVGVAVLGVLLATAWLGGQLVYQLGINVRL